LISPDDNGSGNKDTSFVWKILSDLDGDRVTYYLYVCPGGAFENCEPREIVIGNGNPNTRYAGALGASGMALLLLGFGFTRGGRRTLLVMIAAMTLAGSTALIACGAGGGGSDNDGVTAGSCASAGADSLCRDMLNLSPGNYQWKVLADDSRGGQIESETRIFTVR